MKTAWIIGGGLSAATASYELRKMGWRISAFERTLRWGGLSRSDTLDGVIYEPHGSHIFHTDDREVWELASSLTPFWRYEHTVKTFARLGEFTWPLQFDELEKAYGEEARKIQYFRTLEGTPRELSFEDWCLKIMPRVIYDDFIGPYTEKQWGRPGSDLDSSFAPKRVQVRHDGDKRLFKDEHQGYPDAREGGSYDQMHTALWGSMLRHGLWTGQHITLWSLLNRIRRKGAPDAVIVTAPLDDFCSNVLGELEWRGLTFKAAYLPSSDETRQTHMVYNFPQKSVPYIRTHETKVASRQAHKDTIVITEYPGGPGRYYPVPGKGSHMRERNSDYKEYVTRVLEPFTQVRFCGRLADFAYYDQDDVMRSALDTARSL